MSYGQIVAALTRSLGKEIIGYDNLPDHGGCILYMGGRVKRIDITTQALELRTEDLAAFIQQAIRQPPASGASLRVGIRDGTLTVL